MSTSMPQRGLQLRSLIHANGELELALHTVEVAPPEPTEVVVRVEAAPINPSDIGLLFGAADLETLATSGSGASAKATARVPERALRAMAGRAGQSLPVGNEGAGVVVAAGSSAAAQALLGKTVALLGGAMYAQYRTIKEDQCLVLPPGTTAGRRRVVLRQPAHRARHGRDHAPRRPQGAGAHRGRIQPRADAEPHLHRRRRAAGQHRAQARAGAAVARRRREARGATARRPRFMSDLTQALVATGATIAFDATGGGKLAGQILTAMEAALLSQAKEYSRYGSTTHKQVYLYGSLDTGPTEFNRAFGMAWGIGGWLLMPFLQRIGPHAAQALKQRVANELKTTFASHYSREISLPEALQRDVIQAYSKRATGAKFLINPSRGL